MDDDMSEVASEWLVLRSPPEIFVFWNTNMKNKFWVAGDNHQAYSSRRRGAREGPVAREKVGCARRGVGLVSQSLLRGFRLPLRVRDVPSACQSSISLASDDLGCVWLY